MFQLLERRSFRALTITQFLGAFNDNAFKQLVLLLSLTAALPWIQSSALPGGQVLPSALFALPFVLFGALTGSLADRVSKTRIIVWAKGLEVLVMGLAVLAFALRSYELLMGVVFLMGLQSALFGPSKYGSLPELLRPTELSQGNAIIQMTTMLAVILGALLGGFLMDAVGVELPWVAGLVYLTLAGLGTFFALRMKRLPVAAPGRPLGLNVFRELRGHWRAVREDRVLVLSVLASAFFYLTAALLILVVNQYGDHLGLSGKVVALLNGVTAVGVALGSVLAGRISGQRIEGGLVPLGLLGMAASLLVVHIAPDSVGLLAASLLGVGVSAGLFSIPIRALIQHRPAAEKRGAVLGFSEVLDWVGILAASGAFFLMQEVLHLTPPGMFLLTAGGVLVFTVGSLFFTAEFALRLVLLVLVHTVYRIRVKGRTRLPVDGGALLVSNHLSFVDAFLIAAASPRPVRFLMYRGFFDLPVVGRFARMMGAIPVSSADSRRAKAEALVRAAECARNGELVCIFAEGAISRTGAMLPFAGGLERIARKAGVPIVPVALDRVWGSIFSFEGQRVFWKLPQRLPYPVDVAFGEPLPSDTGRWEVRNRIAELIARGREERESARGSLVYRFLASARRHARRVAIVDGTGARLSYRRLLIGSLAMRSQMRRELGPAENVGLMLPPSAGGAVANLGLSLAGRVPVNLNYTLTNAELADPIERAGLRQVITSRRFLKALERESPVPPERTVFLEDLVRRTSRGTKLRAALVALLPGFLLARLFNPVRSARQPATVLFSSGSTSRPKGVVLSHGNILSNIQGMTQMLSFETSDRLLGVLPFFHSFGYTVTLWAPLLNGSSVAFHANPLDAKTVLRMCEEEGVTMLLATPTFYQAWLRRGEPEQLRTVRVALSGAEKLRDSLADAWYEKFGFELLEGYGCTELSPVVSVNVPDVSLAGSRERGSKRGTIGRPLPGIAVRIVDPETGRDRAAGEEGLLLVRGPAVMCGYLDEPERTAEVLKDGWYVTGDIARMDQDGFLVITDRLSRFAKIGGEMVPHGRVEEALTEILARETAAEEVELAVTSVPDARKGERLVVLHTQPDLDAEGVVGALRQAGLPALFVPRADCFVEVSEIPKLGTGKTDLRALKTLATEAVGPAPAELSAEGGL